MGLPDVVNIVAAAILSVGGAGAIMVALSKFFGERVAERWLAGVKAGYAKEAVLRWLLAWNPWQAVFLRGVDQLREPLARCPTRRLAAELPGTFRFLVQVILRKVATILRYSTCSFSRWQ